MSSFLFSIKSHSEICDRLLKWGKRQEVRTVVLPIVSLAVIKPKKVIRHP